MNVSSSSPSVTGTFAIGGPEALASVRLQLLATTRYKLAAYLPSLPSNALSSPEELAHLRRIATSGRGADIRIVLGDPANALRIGHRLIDLAQRLPSMLHIRTPGEEDRGTDTDAHAWILNDSDGYLFLPDANQWAGRASLSDASGQAPLRLQFEQIWERALPATQLQPLGL